MIIASSYFLANIDNWQNTNANACKFVVMFQVEKCCVKIGVGTICYICLTYLSTLQDQLYRHRHYKDTD